MFFKSLLKLKFKAAMQIPAINSDFDTERESKLSLKNFETAQTTTSKDPQFKSTKLLRLIAERTNASALKNT